MLIKLLDVTYFSSVYFVITLLIGVIINKIFPDYDEQKNNHVILTELLLQMMVIILSGYLIKYIANKMPIIFDARESLSQKKIDISGNIITSLVFFSTQKHFVKKIIHLQNEIEMLFK